MLQVQTVQFHGTTLQVVVTPEGQQMVAIKPICEGIGIDAASQREKIRRNININWRDIPSVGADGREREMFCIPLDRVNGWLYFINATKIPNLEVRARLFTYQTECYEVLFRHFMPNGVQDLAPFMEALTGIKQDMVEVKQACKGLRDEVDELRSALDLFMTESESEDLRALIRYVASRLKVDGRTVVGRVRSTLNISSVYGAPDLRLVINTLRNLAGEGIRLVKPDVVSTREGN